MLNKNWTRQLVKLEITELAADSLKTLRLLTDHEASSQRVLEICPDLLQRVKPRIMENIDSKNVMKEARGLLYNIS